MISSVLLFKQADNIISLLLALDSHLAYLQQVLVVSSKVYRNSTRHIERALCFEELTAGLGSGLAGCEGASGWRCNGVTGVRTLIIELLLLLYHQPSLRALLWSGQNVVSYLAHWY